MKLVRMNDEKIGLFVVLSEGPHVIDIANSLGVFLPHDLLSNGILNGAFKDGCNWSLIVKHWRHLQVPLRQLANTAAARPDHPQLALQPFAEGCLTSHAADQIAAMEITGTEEIAGTGDCDPTGRHAMERQFISEQRNPTWLAFGDETSDDGVYSFKRARIVR